MNWHNNIFDYILKTN